MLYIIYICNQYQLFNRIQDIWNNLVNQRQIYKSSVIDYKPQQMTTVTNGSTGKTGSYFEEKKRGQMNELKNMLNNIINDPESKKAREVVRKVIGYMTLGMDASPVFSQMCRASYTNDEVTKKMIYFYLTTYAEDNPDLAIMAVNTFKKDCKHSSSKVRGLALRNLCSFKSADYVNNALPTIRELLNDFQPYVKKTAIMGVLKVFYVQPETIFNDQSIINTLSSLIRDSDSLVSFNALTALNEIFISQGGIPLTTKLVMYLYNRLKQYNQWSQASILDILYSYTPKSQKQHYEILTILWQKLKHSSTCLVLGSIKIIIKLTKQKQDLFKSVVQKIKAPLLTLMTGSENSGTFETTFIILNHIQYVITEMGGKTYFEKDFKYFYCRADEPSYTKQIKLRILGRLANQFNMGDMLNQLNDYVLDIDVLMARKAIQILTQIAITLPEVSKALIINIMAFHKTEKPHLVNQSIIAYYHILRKHPLLFKEIKSILLQYQTLINEPQSVKAFIWILGTFAQQIDDSPYILQQFVNGESQNLQGKFQQYPQDIKQTLLTQTVQTFVKRPPQTYATLGLIMKNIFDGECNSIILKDHASFYYRALRDNPNEVKRGFAAVNGQMGGYKEHTWSSNAQQDFNNMVLIYKRKETIFIKNYEHFLAMRKKQLGLYEPQIDDQYEDQLNLNGNLEEIAQPTKQYEYDTIEATDLQEVPTLSPEQFQNVWSSLTEYNQFRVNLNPQYIGELTEQSVEELFKMWFIFSIASAEEGNVLKFYMYVKHVSDQLALMEVHVNKDQQIFALGTKANHAKFIEGINNYIANFMAINEFVLSPTS